MQDTPKSASQNNRMQAIKLWGGDNGCGGAAAAARNASQSSTEGMASRCRHTDTHHHLCGTQTNSSGTPTSDTTSQGGM